jgi:hypothetical protein
MQTFHRVCSEDSDVHT